jgi:hypothetical protein
MSDAKHDAKPAIERAISHFGSESAVARAAQVSQPVVHEARKTGRVGPKLALGLMHAMPEIKGHHLRPDLWPAPMSEAAE